jgi:hypothetical protein
MNALRPIMRKAIVPTLTLALLAGVSVGPATAKKRKAAPPITFEASGRFTVKNILAEPGQTSHSNYGITGNEFVAKCAIPATQEFDGFVVELPDEISKVAANVSLRGYAESGTHDTYMVFFDADCKVTGHSGSWEGGGEGAFDAGTKYVLVSARLGALLSFTLTAVEVR